MDLLGSIMDSMDKPPTLTDKEKELIKKRKEYLKKKDEAEKEYLKKFKENIESTMIKHFETKINGYIKFAPMDQIKRSIVHETSEQLGYISYAFGIDGVDRYVRVYRKENLPCEDELAARRRGEPWNEKIRQDLIQSRNKIRVEEKPKIKEIRPCSNYKDKYAHIIGRAAALEAAVKTEVNKSYGFVPSENKKDVRSIEQTMADIKAKKKLKTSHTIAKDTIDLQK